MVACTTGFYTNTMIDLPLSVYVVRMHIFSLAQVFYDASYSTE